MKILLCSKNDLFGALILNWILPKLHAHQVRVLLSDKTRPAENDVLELSDEKFFERDLPIGMIFPYLDRLGESGTLLTFKSMAARFGVDISLIDDINSASSERDIRNWAPDVIVSARFSLIFKQAILRIPRLGSYNIHPGALPSYGGLYAPFRALMNRDALLGCTLHQIDLGIDTGPIHSVSTLTADPSRSLFWHIGALYPLGLAKMLELLEHLSAGKTPVLECQDKSAFHYYKLPVEQDFARFRALGLRTIDLNEYRKLLNEFSSMQPLSLVDEAVTADRLARVA